MTLRARLVLALGVFVAAGLAAFGIATYVRYSKVEYERLDDQLRAALPTVSRQLSNAVGLNPGRRRDDDDRVSDSAVSIDSFTSLQVVYAELRDPNGTVLAVLKADSAPALPDGAVDINRIFTVGSKDGSGKWRVATSSPDLRGAAQYQVILATTTSGVRNSLNELLVIEIVGGLAILLVLLGGSWLIIRRGLRPLEAMGDTARSINAGDLSLRVDAGTGKGEVGQLGTALNSMLDEIEDAFREREETERRLRQFLSDASHELRTPLTSIQGFAELFRLGQQSEHVDQAVIMRRIEAESARMKHLVEDLLLLARLDETRAVERSEVDLAVLAADACSDAVALDPTRLVTLDAPEPVVVFGNQDHLRQAITNLVSNAIKHTPPGTGIDLSAHWMDRHCAVLTVRDHGPGLTDEALAHVFERFWQADSSRTGSGVGLGLAIVDSIAREHNGRVHATNAAEGGAVFSIEIPLADAPHSVASDHAQEQGNNR